MATSEELKGENTCEIVQIQFGIGKLTKGNLTGIPRRLKDITAEWFNSIQHWNSQSITGSGLIKAISDEVTNQKDMSILLLFDGLRDVFYSMEDILTKMDSLHANLLALQSMDDMKKNVEPYFQCWSIEMFVANSQKLLLMFHEDYEVKKIIKKEIAHISDQDTMSFYYLVWMYQPNLDYACIINAMLEEVGHSTT